MIFYEIKLKSLPKIKFACSVNVDNYKNFFGENRNVLEISFIEQGDIVFEYRDGTKETVLAGTLISITKDILCKTYSASRETQKHTTVGITADYECVSVRRNSDDISDADASELRERVKSGETILVPFRYIPEEKSNDILAALKKISEYYSSFYPTDYCSALAEWFSLAGMLGNIVLNTIDRSAVSPSNLNYMHKAEEYIKNHYCEKISVGDIASEIGISEGYLYSIFRQVKRMSVIEFINRFRVETAKQYIENQNLSLKEAAFQVGIDDPSYMSRLFKKMNSRSFRQYKSIWNERKTIDGKQEAED